MSNIIKIKNKFYDFGTKNTSFIQTAQELKALGIKNWYFMLEIKYPELGIQDLDPYNKELKPEQMAAIIKECKDNPWYFFREVSTVVVRGVGNLPLYLHRAGCAAIWCFMHSIDFELVQPRQTYKTTVLTAIMSYAFLFEYQNADIPYMHQTETRCLENIEILRDYIMALPTYMNPWANMKHPPGTKSLRYENHNVSIAPVSAAKSESVATGKMRGYSLFMWFVDECEFVDFMKAVIDGANPTIVQARITAEKMGIRHCMMYASTPGDLETENGRQWQEILDNLPRFKESMYDLSDEELKHLKSLPDLNDEEDRDRIPITMVYIEYNHVQLRKDEKYLKLQYIEAIKNNAIGEYRRGVLLQRFRGDNAAIFIQSDIEYITSHIREPDHEIPFRVTENSLYTMYVYDHNISNPDVTSQYPWFDKYISYLIGIDIASGGKGDNTVFCVVHPYTMEVVAYLITPYMGSFDLMRIVTMIAKLIPRGLFCPETNSIGKTIVDFVQESQLESRFYHDPQLDIAKNAIRKDDPVEVIMRKRAEAKQYIGTYVTGIVRNNMIDLLKRNVHDFKHLIYAPPLVSEICNLVKKKNGKIEAAAGCHDDMVMAYLHTVYVLTYGHDLTRFGIDKNLCTFEKVLDILKEYDDSVAEDQINNMIPYEDPNAFENQLLNDLVNSHERTFNQPGGVDVYGYKPNQYNGIARQPSDQLESLSASQLEFFMDVNNILM